MGQEDKERTTGSTAWWRPAVGPRPAAPLPTALPDDFYVTLQPLTLELVARQLERISIKFTRNDNALVAVWPDRYTMTTRVLPGDILSIRVVLATSYHSEAITALHARCNWWNESRAFLKASVQAIPFRAVEDGDGRHRSMAGVNLDMAVPYTVGIAPVQLQALVEDLLRNVQTFETEARLDALNLEPDWR
jgi:hypothetical protein